MTSPNQVEIVSDHVEDARRKGARILTGGRRKEGPGHWYEPTVIADADHSMTVMRDETFGPVVPVMKVRDTEEALRMANDTTYGLGGAVFAGEVADGERIARRVQAGTVAVNDIFMTNYSVLGLPMGGWKQLRDRLPPRRGRDSQVLPHRVADRPSPPTAEARVPLVPVQPATAGHRQAAIPAAERPRPPQPARAPRSPS